jgi:hypothetical protein
MVMAEKKKLKLTTELIGVSGTFCSYWGHGKSEYVLHEESMEDDFKEGVTDIHPDYYYWHFDNKKYMEALNKRVHEYLEEFIVDLLRYQFDIDVEYTAKGYDCPQYYNYRGDHHYFDLEAESFQPVLDYCLSHGKFEQFLKDNYSSRDGFISWTANNVEKLLEDIKEDDMTGWGAVFSFLFDQEVDPDEFVGGATDAMSQDMMYTEFVNYEALDEFMGELNADLNYIDLDTEWKKAIFERHVGSSDQIRKFVQENYVQLSREEMVTHLLGILEIEEDPSDLIKKIVNNMVQEIESHTLKLDL